MLSLAPIVFKNWPRWSAKVSLNFCWVDDIKTLFRGNLCLPVHVFVDEKEREREKDQFNCLVYKTIRKFFNAQHSETCSEHLNGWCIWINSLTKEGAIGENTVRRIHIMLRGFREEHLTGLQMYFTYLPPKAESLSETLLKSSRRWNIFWGAFFVFLSWDPIFLPFSFTL